MPATVLNFPFQWRAVSIEAITASHSLSVDRNEYFGLGIVSSTPFWVVASQASQIVFISSATGPSARPTPVEMAPVTASTLSCSASLRKRSTVSLGLDSSSTTSSILRPRMPPAALMRSAAHCTPRRPDSPTGASTPAFAASTPSFTGVDCANAGAISSPTAAAAVAPAVSWRNCRRVVRMHDLLVVISLVEWAENGLFYLCGGRAGGARIPGPHRQANQRERARVRQILGDARINSGAG